MNLYSLHTNPEQLAHYENRIDIPLIAYNEALLLSRELNRKQQQDIKNYKHLLPTLAKDPKVASEFSFRILRGRFKLAEPLIMKHPKIAGDYAENNFEYKGWPEAEPYIMKDPWAAYEYSRFVISERWPEAEKYIKQDPKAWEEYKTNWNMNEPI